MILVLRASLFCQLILEMWRVSPAGTSVCRERRVGGLAADSGGTAPGSGSTTCVFALGHGPVASPALNLSFSFSVFLTQNIVLRAQTQEMSCGFQPSFPF